MTELEQAMAQRLVLEVRYNGGMRLVEPYVLFEDKEGERLLRVWQIGGYSSTGKIPNWRSFKVASIADARVLRTPFIDAKAKAADVQAPGAVRILASIEGVTLDALLLSDGV
jgi:hypothetical protein